MEPWEDQRVEVCCTFSFLYMWCICEILQRVKGQNISSDNTFYLFSVGPGIGAKTGGKSVCLYLMDAVESNQQFAYVSATVILSYILSFLYFPLSSGWYSRSPWLWGGQAGKDRW